MIWTKFIRMQVPAISLIAIAGLLISQVAGDEWKSGHEIEQIGFQEDPQILVFNEKEGKHTEDTYFSLVGNPSIKETFKVEVSSVGNDMNSNGSILPGTTISGNIWHVALDGLDSNPGTHDAPFSSIQKGIDSAGPGDIVRIGPGVYYERIEIRQSGEEGAPVVLEGTRGSDGERKTWIDAGQAVDPSTWQAAPEVGPNVFQNESFDYEPQFMTVDGKSVGHVYRHKDIAVEGIYHSRGEVDIPEDHRWRSMAMEVLSWPEHHRETTRYLGGSVRFWDVIGGVYAHHSDEQMGITYLRLANGVDPRQHEIAISDGGAVITIDNASYIHLKGLAIRNGETGIGISGEEALHNMIDDCYLTHGRVRVNITDGASYNTVSNNHMTMGFLGSVPGAWGGGRFSESAAENEYLYNFFKYLHGRGTSSDDRSVAIAGDARGNVIEGNHLEGGLIGIASRNNTGLIVRNNHIHGFSSVGILVSSGTIDGHFHDNSVHNSNINVRVHDLSRPGSGHRAYIYRNLIFQPGPIGSNTYSHVFVHDDDYPEPEISFYHNTFVGGSRVVSLNPRLSGYPEFQFLNNIILVNQPISAAGILYEHPKALGIFDYNWIGGDFLDNKPGWFGNNNIIDRGGQLWSDTTVSTDFHLPEDHPAREAGIDLSQPFSISGKVYEPLPGMEPGYFSGEHPDLGAVQYEYGN